MVKTGVGDTVNIGNVDYLVVHIDEANKHLYLAKKYEDSTERGVFNQSSSQTTYEGSTIHTKCKQFYANEIPEEYKTSGILQTPTEAIDCPVFIPTRQQVGGTNDSGRDDTVAGEWDYFKDKNSRIFKNESGSAYPWWLQSQWPTNSSTVCCVDTDGRVYRNCPNDALGFRPTVCAKMELLDYLNRNDTKPDTTIHPAMKFVVVKRNSDVAEVLLLPHKGTSSYSFVNLTKGHIGSCIFNSAEDAIVDMKYRKAKGLIKDYYRIE